MKDIVLLLAKFPNPHKVKTRLIYKNIITAADAAKIYSELLNTLVWQLDFYKMNFALLVEPNELALFKNSAFNRFKLIPRIGSNKPIGEVILDGFKILFDLKYERIVVSVTDVIYEDLTLIDKSFKILKNNKITIGKSDDGGFYLLGLNEYLDVFQSVKWSTESVLTQVLANCRKQNQSVELLPSVLEVDEITDLFLINSRLKESSELRMRYPFIWLKSNQILAKGIN